MMRKGLFEEIPCAFANSKISSHMGSVLFVLIFSSVILMITLMSNHKTVCFFDTKSVCFSYVTFVFHQFRLLLFQMFFSRLYILAISSYVLCEFEKDEKSLLSPFWLRKEYLMYNIVIYFTNITILYTEYSCVALFWKIRPIWDVFAFLTILQRKSFVSVSMMHNTNEIDNFFFMF